MPPCFTPETCQGYRCLEMGVRWGRRKCLFLQQESGSSPGVKVGEASSHQTGRSVRLLRWTTCACVGWSSWFVELWSGSSLLTSPSSLSRQAREERRLRTCYLVRDILLHRVTGPRWRWIRRGWFLQKSHVTRDKGKVRLEEVGWRSEVVVQYTR